MGKIRRAILSSYDKSGIVELAALLAENNVEIISTSGTLQTLLSAGIKAVNMADFTGVPEMMDGRIKTLHPKIHAGLLGVRDSKLHQEQMQAYEMQWVDMVVSNPAPLTEYIRQPGITAEEVVEHIDIGGTAMIRSAAKNFRYVTVLTNPARYPQIMHEYRALEGELSFATRYCLAQEAFACTASYDQIITDYLEANAPTSD